MAEYKKTLLVYLDLMGFKDLIDESKSDPAKVELIANTLKQMKRQADITLSKSFKSQNFSDLIVRATQPKAGEQIAQLISIECWILASVQSSLFLSSGFMIRGGICFSDLFMENDLVFGPALVRAYELSEKLATFPRILIDPEVVNSVLQDGKTTLSNISVIRGDDAAYFIDYLYVYCVNPNVLTGFSDFRAIMAAHKQQVEKKLLELSSKGERAKQKALWLAIYHNSVVHRVKKVFRRQKIDPTLFLIPDEFLRK
jgi:hypothetical protein